MLPAPSSFLFADAALPWPLERAPQAPRHDHWIKQLGRQRNDPYAWLRYIPDTGSRTLETLPEPLQTQLLSEMAYTSRLLQPLESRQAQWLARLASRQPLVNEPLPQSVSGWIYHSSLAPGHSHRVFSRSQAGGEVQTLLDEAQRAAPHAYYRATDHQPSPNHRYWAWAEDVIGNDRHRIAMLDMHTGQTRTLVADDAFGYGGLCFSASSEYLFWIWRDAHSRPSRLYRTQVETGETTLVYEESDPALFMRIARTAANQYVALTLFGPDTSEVHLIPADAETSPPLLIQPRQTGVRYEINEWLGDLLLLTNAGDAPDRRLVRIAAPSPSTSTSAPLEPRSPSSAAALAEQELVAHHNGRPILSVMPFAQALVRLERLNGQHQLVLRSPQGQDTVVAFPEPIYSLSLPSGQSYDAAHVRVMYQSPTTPPHWLDIGLSDGHDHTVGQEHLAHFDRQIYQVERLYASAPDGQQIPITLLSRRDCAASAAQAGPLLLTGYGAYGMASEPVFSLPAIALVDAGFRYAIAHVRGGSEKGWAWYQGGCRSDKRNSMTDFIACAEHLSQIGVAKPGQIVAHGISAGGLLVCGAMNMAPHLWAGVIAEVPFVDMLNTMSDANHPLVPLLRPDWGDPLADANAYDHMIAISPYESVHAAPYPPLLCTAGLKDDRVPYWEPVKLIAAIRHESTSTNPAMLLLDPDSGHQGSDDQHSQWAHTAWLWAFAQQCIELAERQRPTSD